MSVLKEIMDFNKDFVDSGEYVQFFTDKYPNKQIAVLSCMDARIVELLPKAMGLKNGDAKLIKNAGALVTHPWGSVMRSLLVAVLELGANEIFVVSHMDCGMRGFDPEHLLERAKAAGITEKSIETLRNAGIDLDTWLKGFENVDDSVRHTVDIIKKHPLMPKSIPIHGLVIHPTTGQLHKVVDGYAVVAADAAKAAEAETSDDE
ncbi:beta-class carbonic anhydrase [Neisseriaceae bacterium CLB008]|nr:carbonic anhydrase [Neisseriaceae bacterium]